MDRTWIEHQVYEIPVAKKFGELVEPDVEIELDDYRSFKRTKTQWTDYK